MTQPSILTSSSPIDIALLETSKDIADPFVEIARDCGIIPHTRIASWAEMPDIARRMETKLDVIMCRSGTAERVAEAVSIPVIAIPITSFDVAAALHRAKDRGRHISVFCFRRTFAGMEVLEELYDCRIHQHAFTDPEEIPDLVAKAREAGVDCCVGGGVTYAAARRHGLRAIHVSPNEDSIFRSLREALQVVKVRREDRSRTAWLEVVLDTISQGIVVTDTDGKVVVYNGSAQRICRITDDDVVGKDIRDVVGSPEIALHFGSEERETATLKTIHGETFALRKRPVVLDEKTIGTVSTLEDITRIQHLEELIRTQMNAKGLRTKYVFDDILGESAQIHECRELAARYAPTSASVLIEGESGTGKELFAQSLHAAGNRPAGPFVAVNCAAIPEALLESELFGYEGGAFTSARKEGKPGLFEQAHRGTIFLDEIGEIPAPLQARLLRVLQEREVRRVGGDKVIAIDIRIVAATNKNLIEKVREGQFREDLFYRLNVLSLKIPPLRERKEDIRILARSILRGFSIDVSDEILDAIEPTLTRHDWPGNVRELHNVLERLSLLVTDARRPSDWRGLAQQVLHVADDRHAGHLQLTVDTDQTLKSMLRQAERDILRRFVDLGSDNLSIVADRLDIGRTSLWRKLKDR